MSFIPTPPYQLGSMKQSGKEEMNSTIIWIMFRMYDENNHVINIALPKLHPEIYGESGNSNHLDFPDSITKVHWVSLFQLPNF